MPTATPAEGTRWIQDPALAHKLSEAVESLLESVQLMLEDDYPFSASLEGGGFYTCELHDLDFAWAPLLETETARLVAEAATDVSPGLFAPELPALIAAIDAQPMPVQQALIGKATARHLARPAVPTAGQITAQVHTTSSTRPYEIPLTATRGPRR
ncbi:hypothetical protein SAMN05216267_103919 [Actinacidiphila rubida]|uniref:Uncharacterized protein n=1 Tax=Actinacidiphila rubida TaxID=310780 RepID=A0A1H8S527_9ACTN|nr:hypothetical protein [Actinacidiphila rubida]SEO73428.1 hypothetical protein SAMN05216267_103919 [Actinacidiphila rubida]